MMKGLETASVRRFPARLDLGGVEPPLGLVTRSWYYWASWKALMSFLASADLVSSGSLWIFPRPTLVPWERR